MSYYLFNSEAPGEQAAGWQRVGMWGVDADEPERDALAAGERLDSPTAQADFAARIVEISLPEYETVLEVAAG